MEGKRCNNRKLLMDIPSPSLQLYFPEDLSPIFSLKHYLFKARQYAKENGSSNVGISQRDCLVNLFSLSPTLT